MTELCAIGHENADEVADFLHRELNPSITRRAWRVLFATAQPVWADNRGFLLRTRDGVVGCYGALYSEWPIAGKAQRFCNLHSWCVLSSERGSSLDLVRALLRQRGLHFFNPTPNPMTVKIFEGLRFSHLDSRVAVMPTALGAWTPHPRARIRRADETSVAALGPSALHAYRCHRECAALIHLVLECPEGSCYVVLRRVRWRGVSAAELLHPGRVDLFWTCRSLVQRWLLRSGVWVLRAECRFLPPVRWLAKGRGQPRMVLSRELSGCDFSLLFSDLALLSRG